MTRPGGENGWTKPAIIVALLSFVANLGWAWVGIQRDDSKEMMNQLNANSLAIAVLTSRVAYLEAERDRENRNDRVERRH